MRQSDSGDFVLCRLTELFFTLDGEHAGKPMKGTAPRRTLAKDDANYAAPGEEPH
jgi:hypothetical protein